MEPNKKINTLKCARILKFALLLHLFFIPGLASFAQSGLQFYSPKIIMKMETTDFTSTIVVDQKPEQVFNAINNVRGWWSEEIEGNTNHLNEVFNYHYEDVHRCEIKIVEFVPNKKIVWEVLDNYFKFTQDKTEWIGTKIIFDISEKDGKTQLVFTHAGLTPQYECYEICRDAWTTYIQSSLRNLITTGKGQPNGKGKPQTENEKALESQH